MTMLERSRKLHCCLEYVTEFAGRHNARKLNAEMQMACSWLLAKGNNSGTRT